MKITEENILEESRNCNRKVLDSPLAAIELPGYERRFTPLHILAIKGVVEVLKHPAVDKVKDIWLETPLHELADVGNFEVLTHNSVDKVKDRNGWTPLHFLIHNLSKSYLFNCSVPNQPRYIKESLEIEYFTKIYTLKKWLKEKYPWVNLAEKELTLSLITEILNTPNAEKFIFSLFSDRPEITS